MILARRAVVAGLALVPAPAMAAGDGWPIPWDGYWRGEHEDCAFADRYEGPRILSETLCLGLSAEPLATDSGWLVQMRCDDEGRVWTSPRVVLLDGDRQWIWFGPGGLGVIALHRCAASEEY